MNMTCTYIHNFQFTTISITCVFIFISLLLIIPSEYSYSLSSFCVCTREVNLVPNHCMDRKNIYTLLCTLCIYFYKKKYDYKLYLYIITEVAQIWSRVFSVLRFILGCMTCRDLAWNTTQKNSHKWSHLIRYGWCDEFISFGTCNICWYKSFSHSKWQNLKIVKTRPK